eukprot:10880196-Heterocapsa_arctica.AAC.1
MTISGPEDSQPALQVWLGHRVSLDLLAHAQVEFQHFVQCDLPTDLWLLYPAGVVDENWRRFCMVLLSSLLCQPALFGQCLARHAV